MGEQVDLNKDQPPYTKIAGDVYDAIYAWKDYAVEAARLKQLISQYKRSEGNELLEVACGTGLYLPHLVDEYTVTGLDLSEQQLEVAQRRLPDATFAQGDMRTFNLGRQFDVVTCLFSSIGYVHPYSEMQEVVKNMAAHLKSGGVLVVEPWLQLAVFSADRTVHQDRGELPEKHLSVTRTSFYRLEGNLSTLRMQVRVESPRGGK